MFESLLKLLRELYLKASGIFAGRAHTPRYMWCLDNGHGRLTAGKRSPSFDDGITQFFEYEFNRDIVQRIMVGLELKGVKYFEVVPETEVGDFLEERVNRANGFRTGLPKVFVSVHSNAAPAASPEDWCDPSIKGVETWHYYNSVAGKAIATVFQEKLVEATGMKDRGIRSRQDAQFYVLRKTAMPAVLTENGFYNNKEEAKELMNPAARQKIADAHIDAIMQLEATGF